MRNLAGFCVKSMIAVFGIVSLTLMGPNSVSAEEATKYSPDSTAILMVDPFNDFISEGGVLWHLGAGSCRARKFSSKSEEAG